MSRSNRETLTTPGAAVHVQDPMVGEQFGVFALGQELGRGGMGRVLAAWDPELHRSVALKTLHDPDHPGLRARFLAEAQITAQLEHPNIVPVHQVGLSSEGRAWFVMRRVDGRSLREVLDALASAVPEDLQYWTRRRLLNAFVQAGQAVAFAHDRGVVHRDLKPENIMLGRYGDVLVMDWGLARALGSPWDDEPGRVASLPRPGTQWGQAMGTPGYMSPEQARGEAGRVDARSDVWALGAILYEILTGRPAYVGADEQAILAETLAGPPEDPRVRTPDRLVPEELAGIALRALAPRPEDRFASATALLEALEAWLEGSQRRALAAERVAEGRARWQRYLDLHAEHRRLEAERATTAAAVDPWESGPRKAALLDLRDRIAALAVESGGAFAQAVALGERALSFDPGNRDARAFLAEAYWWRHELASAAGEGDDVAYFAERVREYDDGAYRARLDGPGRLDLETLPPGVTVRAARFVRRGLAWPTAPEITLGATPLVARPLEAGSWLLRLQAPGFAPTTYPVAIRPDAAWRGPAVQLPRQALPGFVFVPAGPCRVGGDPAAGRQLEDGIVPVGAFWIQEYPVRAREYAAFLNALPHPEEAVRRAPRRDHGLQAAGLPYWRTPAPGERWEVPVSDADADPWDPDWPVFAVSWHDAMAYAAWRSAVEGRLYTLPSELEWEKAARGVDGRFFPWGDVFDPTAAKTEHSRPGRLRPEPVGSFPLDCSPYGVRDLGGGVRDWCGDPTFDGDPTRRPVRGGCWTGGEKLARAANRYGFEAGVVHSYIGFRLVHRLEAPP